MKDAHPKTPCWTPTIPAEAYEALRRERPCMVRLPKVCELTGLSKSTVWARSREGSFPPAIKLGMNSTGWREADVLAWLEGLPNATDAA